MRTESETLYVEIKLDDGASIELPQAKRDWRDGQFSEVPGEEDFIPLPES